jgi:predicted phosphodiesterase
MRLAVLSDLHLEFGPFTPPAVEADMVVLAGDTSRGKRGLEWARQAFAGRPVVYVAGNHEYYTHALPKLTEELRAGSDEHVHFLEQECVEIAGVRFFGCTLWSDFQLLGNPSLARDTAQLKMSDYRKIRVSPQYRRLRARDTLDVHYQSRRWLQEAMERGVTRGAVIVTHHAPSARSLPPQMAADWLSPAYASDLDALIEACQAALWVHGHTHWPVDYRVGSTRVVSNPRGYTDEPVRGFDPGLVVEL